MIELKPPEIAVRMRPAWNRKTASVWHLQHPDKKNKTVCGYIIADGRGHKYRNPGWHELAHRRQLWEMSRIEDLEKEKGFCRTCLGAMTVEKLELQRELI